jgi:YihY family inner membrane protein
MDVKGRIARLDEAQQKKPALAVPIATIKKYNEDKSSNLAAMMAFWGFFSIFPLMLAAVTVLGYTLPESDKERVLAQISGYFPLLGKDTQEMAGLNGSVLALVVGLLAALWSGSAVIRIVQDAFNSVWEVPQVERPKMLEQVKRSMLALSTIGVGLVASTFLLGFVTGDNPSVDLGPLGRILGFAAAIVLDIGLFVLAFRMLTDRAITTRDVLPGAVFAGFTFWLLGTLSSIIITRHLSSASQTYGNFAMVITILWWFYLQAQLTLFGAQVNVVLKCRYWPRALLDPPATEADRRLMEDFVKARQLVKDQEVETEFVPGSDESAGQPDGSEQHEKPEKRAEPEEPSTQRHGLAGEELLERAGGASASNGRRSR